jgi:hypothetical protein
MKRPDGTSLVRTVLWLGAAAAFVLLRPGASEEGLRPAGLPVARPPQSVKVVNGSGDSVPVTLGSKSNFVRLVNGTKVAIAPGSVVGIDPTQGQVSLAPYGNGVTVLNDPARAAFTTQKLFNIAAGDTANYVFVDVPEGKRLVVEYMTLLLLLPKGQLPGFPVGVDTPTATRFLALTPTYNEFGSAFLFAGEVRMYADSYLQVTVSRVSPEFVGEVRLSIDGYLVDK